MRLHWHPTPRRGEWPPERFREHGIIYDRADKTKSGYYLELLPLVNSQHVELLDHPKVIGQLCNLERRTARGGRDTVDHPPVGQDDLINAVAGAAVRAADGARGWRVMDLDEPAAATQRGAFSQQLLQGLPDWMSTSLGTCGSCKNLGADAAARPYCKRQRFMVRPTDPACELYYEPKGESGP